MPSERVLLVGGGGFIGQALAQRLAGAGREVHVLSRHADGGMSVSGIVRHRACQSDAAAVAPLLDRCDTVIHLASETTPGASAAVPTLDVRANLAPLASFIEILAASPLRRVVFLSSGGAIYGNPARLPVAEDHPLHPLSYHAAGKAAAELLLGTFARQSGTALAILRPANVYGPGQPLRAGFGFVRTLLEKARLGAPVEIWGDGRQVRDFLYIDDLVEACVRLIDAPAVVGVFNAGAGTGVALLDLVDLVRAVTGQTLPVKLLPERGIDVAGITLDCQKLHETLAWRAGVPLAEGVSRTWHWLANR